MKTVTVKFDSALDAKRFAVALMDGRMQMWKHKGTSSKIRRAKDKIKQMRNDAPLWIQMDEILEILNE